MPLHDYECPQGHEFESTRSFKECDYAPCPECKQKARLVWKSKAQNRVAFGTDETAVVWEHPKTGDTKYPGLSTAAMPERYRNAGYVRRELRSDQDYARFEKQKGVLSERRWFDKGSGKSFDNDGRL